MAKARLITAAILAIVFGAGLDRTAHAQIVGTYGGASADGTPVSISVGQFRGKTYITFVQVQANTKCHDGTTYDLNTFEAGLFGIVTGPSVTLSAATSNTYVGGTLSFDNATRSVSGFLFEELSKLAAAPGQPTKTTLCVEARQAFAAVLGNKVDFDPKLMTLGDGGAH